jgi:hypothetical protein
MARIILGVIAGFLVWSILWIGSDQVLIAALGWYAEHQNAFRNAFTKGSAFETSSTVLVMNIVRSVIISFISGYLAAMIARENRWSTLILGILLLLFGLMVEIAAWKYLPLWYHLVFLLLIVPMTIAGGKVRKPVKS